MLSDMGSVNLSTVRVRPIHRSEFRRYRALLDEHHYLGFTAEVGARLHHVAEEDGKWLALVSWSAAAWKVGVRDKFLGSRLYDEPDKLRCVVNNNRFLVLPEGRLPHLASRVLGLSCRRLGRDWLERYGYSVLLAETFVDSRFQGTCYLAAGWRKLGFTRGWARTRSGYVPHGKPKAVWIKELAPRAVELFRASLPVPYFTTGGCMPMINVEDIPLVELVKQFESLTDPRKRFGKRHKFSSLVSLIVLGNLCGLPCIAHIAEWAKRLPNQTLRLLGFRAGLAPSLATLHRVSVAVNVNEFVDVGRVICKKKSRKGGREILKGKE